MQDLAKGKLFWLSYDLGLKGDYERLYYWLDLHKARECGGNVAALYYTKPLGQLLSDDDFAVEIKEELEKIVSFNPEDRVYLVFLSDNKIKGKFIIGRRKPAPWAGFAPAEGEVIVDEE